MVQGRATQYQQGTAERAQQPPLRALGLHDKDVAKRSAIRSQPKSALSYITVASTHSKRPVCLGDHNFTILAGETSSGSRLADWADVLMRKGCHL